MPKPAPALGVEQRHLGLMAQPFGDVDHPVGAFVPDGIGVGASQQHVELRCVIGVVFVARLQTMAKTPPDHAHFKENKLHASLCFFERKRPATALPVIAKRITTVVGDEKWKFNRIDGKRSANLFTLYSDLFSS